MTTYYFSNQSGDDTNDGLTTSTPKQTLNLAFKLLTEGIGNTVLMKRGDYWQSNSTQQAPNLLVKTPGSLWSYMDAYGTGEKPIINGLLYDDGTGWTNNGDGTYSKTFSGSGGCQNSMWYNAAIQTDPSTWIPMERRHTDGAYSTNIVDVLLEGDQFHSSGDVITLFGDPSTKGGIMFTRSTTLPAVYFRDMNKLRISNIFFMGYGVKVYADLADCADIEFIDCDDVLGDKQIFEVFTRTTSQHINRVTWDNLLDRTVSDYRVANTQSPRAASSNGSSDHIYCHGGVNEIEIVDCKIKAAKHSAFNIKTDTTKGTINDLQSVKIWAREPLVSGYVDFSGNYSATTGKNEAYSRWLDMATQSFLISGMLFKNITAQTQIAGSGTIVGCKFTDFLGPIDLDSTALHIDLPMMFWSPQSGDFACTTRKIIIKDCIFDNPISYPIYINNAAGAGTLPQNAIELHNCTIRDQTYYNDRYKHFTNTAYPKGVILYDNKNTGGLVNTQIVQNCKFIIPNGETRIFIQGNASGVITASTNFNEYTCNGYTGAEGNEVFYTTSAAGVNDNLLPTAQANVGVHYGYIKGANGKYKPNPARTGAFDYPYSAKTRTGYKMLYKDKGYPTKASFTPADYSPAVWYNFEAANVTKDGSNLVSTVNDISGNGKHLTTIGSPLWIDDYMNGKPCLDLNGSTQAMYNASVTLDTYHTVYVVLKVEGVNANSFFMEHGINSASAEGAHWMANPSSSSYAVNRGPGTRHTAAGPSQWLQETNRKTVVGAWRYNGTHELYKNRTVQANGSITGSAHSDTSVAASLNIGNRDVGGTPGSLWSDAKLVCILIFNERHNNAQFAQMHQWIKDYYNA